MRFKNEASGCFLKFRVYVENMFFSKIKSLQTNGGGEYLNTHFQHFLSQREIFHLKQNGAAERKHGHITDPGLMLLSQSGMPHTYWAEAFHAAVYLTNRLSTKLLNYVSPCEKLFH